MEITIGKYTLETLTTGMYDRPKDLFREYIQNAVDSIDTAYSSNLIKANEGEVVVSISKKDKRISVNDNGVGIPSNDAEKFLLDIGNSKKLATNERGFRGIGRLAGLAYCDKLIFETSYKGEEQKSILEFDATKLKKSLLSENNFSLTDIMADVVSIKKEKETKGEHYFKVTLSNVVDVDGILSVESVTEYLSQVAPLKFSPGFIWGDMIKARINYIGNKITEYNLVVEDCDEKIKRNIYKSYSDKFASDRMRKIEDSINEVETRTFYYEDQPLAFLWYANTQFYGTIQNSQIKGIRLRKGNIQLGDRNSLNEIFKDERFNGWLIGELHVLSPLLIPNARRDNLEKNEAYESLLGQLKEWADGICVMIRRLSVSRNKEVDKKIEILKSDKITEQTDVIIKKELDYNNLPEYDDVAHSELINTLEILLEDKDKIKYKALELQKDIPIDQKKVLEKVFDIIQSEHYADSLIAKIIEVYAKYSKVKIDRKK